MSGQSAGQISIQGACENNLDNLSCCLPRNAFVTVTGPSGSGKSSLVFDTIYRESLYRFYSSLRVGRGASRSVAMLESDRPCVEGIEGLSYCVGIQTNSLRPVSATLASFTDVYDYLRLLYFHLGSPHCTVCDSLLKAQSRREMVREIMSLGEGTQVVVLAPLEFSSREDLLRRFAELAGEGYVRVEVEGEQLRLDSSYLEQDLGRLFSEAMAETRSGAYLVVDAFSIRESFLPRVMEVLELALSLGRGEVEIEYVSSESGGGSVRRSVMSEVLRCWACHTVQPPLVPSEYSYFRESGWCERCRGTGIVEKSLSGLAFEQVCPSCSGGRLRQKALRRRLGGQPFSWVFTSSVKDAGKWAAKLDLKKVGERGLEREFVGPLEQCLCELRGILSSLDSLGLGYLQLNRSLRSLSSGEFQRAAIARALKQQMSGITYLLDEPSVGLHPDDVGRLISVLRELVQGGATVVAVEHDLQLVSASDFVVELGPGGGSRGGRLQRAGASSEIVPALLERVGDFCKPEEKTLCGTTNSEKQQSLRICGLSRNNLKDITMDLPLGKIVAVVGVSGCGKSSLVEQSLVPALEKLIDEKRMQDVVSFSDAEKLEYGMSSLEGWRQISHVVYAAEMRGVTNPRSTVASLSGALTELRRLYAQTPEARMRGFGEKHFSFNSELGWCRRCKGKGTEALRLQSMSDLRLECRLCGAKRYSSGVQTVLYQGKSIVEMLESTVAEALERFKNIPRLAAILESLVNVELGYLVLSQAGALLSRGEQQRLRFAGAVCRKRRGSGFYVFDEPTRGLSMVETAALTQTLRQLKNQGHSVVVIEHNMQLVRSADYVIELGPGAGEDGGECIASGTPQEIVGISASRIAKYLGEEVLG